jgi:WD40 repeat protein
VPSEPVPGPLDRPTIRAIRRRILDIALGEGGRLATAGSDRTARVWDVHSAEEMTRVRHGDAVVAVVFSADGRRLLTASLDGTARVWDVNSADELTRVAHGGGMFEAVAFSRDGRRIATAGDEGTGRVWDADSGTELTRVQHGDDPFPFSAIALSADGGRIATARDDEPVRVWDASNGARLADLVHGDFVAWIAFSPDGRRIATSGVGARLWDVDSGDELTPGTDSGDELTRAAQARSVSAQTFTADAWRIATGDEDGTVRVWDGESRAELTRIEHDEDVGAVALSLDGRLVATTHRDGTGRIWDVRSGREVNRVAHQRSRSDTVAFGRGSRPVGDLVGRWLAAMSTLALAVFALGVVALFVLDEAPLAVMLAMAAALVTMGATSVILPWLGWGEYMGPPWMDRRD